MDAYTFRQTVKRINSELPPDQEVFFVTSLDNEAIRLKGGVTTEVLRERVGELLTKHTHRLATDEEIEAFKKAQEEHLIQSKMAKIATESRDSVKLFEAMQRLAQVNAIPEPTKKGK